MNPFVALLALSLSLLQQPQPVRKVAPVAHHRRRPVPLLSIAIKAPVSITIIRGNENLVFNTQAGPPAP